MNKNCLKSTICISFGESDTFFTYDVNKSMKVNELKQYKFDKSKNRYKSTLKTTIAN